ncbi:MAG TPA: hypothetical protein VMR34_02040 [Candidatus Saccharimonadales bacterium]|nr:hypothetical protein [Candidatus Saccharimonadales bacterium]
MTYLKSWRECWAEAKLRTERVPRPLKTISAIGLTAMEYIVSGNEGGMRPIIDAVQKVIDDEALVTSFTESLGRITTVASIDGEVLIEEKVSEFREELGQLESLE